MFQLCYELLLPPFVVEEGMRRLSLGLLLLVSGLCSQLGRLRSYRGRELGFREFASFRDRYLGCEFMPTLVSCCGQGLLQSCWLDLSWIGRFFQMAFYILSRRHPFSPSTRRPGQLSGLGRSEGSWHWLPRSTSPPGASSALVLAWPRQRWCYRLSSAPATERRSLGLSP